MDWFLVVGIIPMILVAFGIFVMPFICALLDERMKHKVRLKELELEILKLKGDL